MTHDELLAKLNPVLTVTNITKQYEALRAVVRLHKVDGDGFCSNCSHIYPCSTIEAIGKAIE